MPAPLGPRGRQLARLHLERQPVERQAPVAVEGGGVDRGTALRVSEGDGVERHAPLDLSGIERDRIGSVDVGLEVEILEDALEQRQRGLDLHGHPQQLDDREEQTRLERGEGDDRARADRLPAAVEAQSRDQVDDGRRDAEERLHQREEALSVICWRTCSAASRSLARR